jgi:hypothetical protein
MINNSSLIKLKGIIQIWTGRIYWPEYDWLLCGCHEVVTGDPSPCCDDCSAYCVVTAASVWQSALGEEMRSKKRTKAHTSVLYLFFGF